MKRNIIPILIFSIIGSLFAGYLSYKKLTSNTCVLTEGCANFLGLPTCVYGFLMFFLIFALALIVMTANINLRKPIRIISIIGILFSGSFSVYELFLAPFNILNGAKFSLLLPSCVYGALMFLIIFILERKK
jgi:hypothetical protein